MPGDTNKSREVGSRKRMPSPKSPMRVPERSGERRSTWHPGDIKKKKGSRKGSVVEDALKKFDLIEHGFASVDHSKVPMPMLQRLGTAFDGRVNLMNRFLHTTEGRDKVFKVIQESSQLLSWLFTHWEKRQAEYPGLAVTLDWLGSLVVSSVGGSARTVLTVLSLLRITRAPFPPSFPAPTRPSLAQRLEKIRSLTSTARKYLKLVNAATFLRLAMDIYKVEKDDTLRALALGRMLGLAGYMLMDHLDLAVKLTIIDVSDDVIGTLGLHFLIVSLVFTMILDLKQLWGNHKDLLRAERSIVDRKGPTSPSVAELRSKRVHILVSFLKNLMDTVQAVNALWKFPLSVGLGAALGVASGVIGIQRFYARLQQEEEDSAKAKEKAILAKAPQNGKVGHQTSVSAVQEEDEGDEGES